MQIEEQIKMEAERLYGHCQPEILAKAYGDIFTSGANFVLELMGWVKVGTLPEEYRPVLFLMEDGNITKGFRNTYGELMIGNKGRFAYKYRNIGNPITHWQQLPPPPKD